MYKWFADGTLNTCYNAVDRHVEAGHGDQVAIQFWSPMTQTEEAITYSNLQDRVAKVH